MKKSINKKGSTLIELLVTLFIIVLLLGTVLLNYRKSGQRFALQRSVNKLTHDIRRVQEMAMSTKEHNGTSPPGGYGIHFDKNVSDTNYILFADLNDPPNFSYDGITEKIEEIELEKGVKIDALAYSYFSPITGEEKFIYLNFLDIAFTPIEPAVRILKSTTKSGWVFLKIDEEAKIIRVNPVGLISLADPEYESPICECWWNWMCSMPGGPCGDYFCECCFYWECTPPDCYPPDESSPKDCGCDFCL